MVQTITIASKLDRIPSISGGVEMHQRIFWIILGRQDDKKAFFDLEARNDQRNRIVVEIGRIAASPHTAHVFTRRSDIVEVRLGLTASSHKQIPICSSSE